MGVATGDVVVRLGGIESGADSLLELDGRWSGWGGQAGSNALAGVGERVEGDAGVGEHGREIE